LGNEVVISNHCDIGIPTDLAVENNLIIGNYSVVRSHSVFYLGSTIGEFLTTGHHVTIRENSQIGTRVQIGTLSDIQGDCLIGNYSRLHSNVHVGKDSKIGEFVWLYPYVVLTNDPIPPSNTSIGVTIEDFAVVATMSTLLPGVVIGFGSIVGAHSLVNKSVPPETVVAGSPARVIKRTEDIMNSADGLPAYPWARHFNRGYPEELFKTYSERKLRLI
jgi:acetyltransferase-like isoleucine patch superfamily enzyme